MTDSCIFQNEIENTMVYSPRDLFCLEINNDNILSVLNNNLQNNLNSNRKFSNSKMINEQEINNSIPFNKDIRINSKSSIKEGNLIKININNNYNSFNNFSNSLNNYNNSFQIEKTIEINFSKPQLKGKKTKDNDSLPIDNFTNPIKKYFKKIDSKVEKLILIIDDNQIIRNSIKKVIKSIKKTEKKENISVICLGDGIELLYMIMIDQIMRNMIKLIICDEQMIYLNGTDCFKIINNLIVEKKISKIPFVFCSSNIENSTFLKKDHFPEIKNKAIEYDYLIKPPSKMHIKTIFESFRI